MKRASAFILIVIYMGFTLSAMGYSHSNAVYTHAVSFAAAECDESGNESSCEAHYDATGQFKKTPKHPTHSGKIKMPRPVLANVTVTGSQQPSAHDAKFFTSFASGNNIHSSSLYLRHRVLLI